ncbi:hypothetical protein [Flavobacterium limi]|uniref:Uncharacterized protein n=1 Tax=Flavobacterium limi TaxID=2045105 RepID=A0ABQ1UT19_9FLAO|nr:hypothetical protein [Flavobacterium limi]GGF26500.1 hypothetical protein GCM10011518_39860 [Flavobacterium limi]
MLITIKRKLEVFFGCLEKILNPKPKLNMQEKFHEFLEKLSISKLPFSTEINISTYLQNTFNFDYQPLLIKNEKSLKISILTTNNYVDNSE